MGVMWKVKEEMRRNDSLPFLGLIPCSCCSPPPLSSEWSTSHCRSSERAHWQRPTGCSCICSAGVGSGADPQSPSPPARPSWCPVWMRPLEAAENTVWSALREPTEQRCSDCWPGWDLVRWTELCRQKQPLTELLSSGRWWSQGAWGDTMFAPLGELAACGILT